MGIYQISILIQHQVFLLSEYMPSRCLSNYVKLINCSCSPRALGVRQCTEICEALSIGSSFSTQRPALTRTYLLLHLCNGRRDIITRVYQITFMDGLQTKEEGVKGVFKVKEVK